MALFRIFLVAIIAFVSIYTMFVVAAHGLGLLPIFFGDIMTMGWPGQFNVDFFAFLSLGALWLMWRHHFSIGGILLGICVFAGGAPFVCTYLLMASAQAKGDVATLLLGARRAASSSQ